MPAQSKTYRRLANALVVLLVGGLLLVGCGGAAHAPSTNASRPVSVVTETNPNARMGAQPQPAGDQPSTQNAAITARAKAACEQAVQSAPALAASAKPEIAAFCFRINYIRADNEGTVRSICQEVANASSLANEAARKRTISACYEAAMK